MYIVSYAVMPVRQYVRRMIRHPEGIENTGFRLKDCRNDREDALVYKQTLIRKHDTRYVMKDIRFKKIISTVLHELSIMYQFLKLEAL